MNMFIVAWWSWLIVTGPVGDGMTSPARAVDHGLLIDFAGLLDSRFERNQRVVVCHYIVRRCDVDSGFGPDPGDERLDGGVVARRNRRHHRVHVLAFAAK